VTADFLKDFMNSAMVACGAVPAGVSSAVLSVWLGPEHKYAFIELCTTESAIVALGLNGISCMGHNLRVARPKTYNGDGYC
jgi:splicing factor U2AF 65 kDa subunit